MFKLKMLSRTNNPLTKAVQQNNLRKLKQLVDQTKDQKMLAPITLFSHKQALEKAIADKNAPAAIILLESLALKTEFLQHPDSILIKANTASPEIIHFLLNILLSAAGTGVYLQHLFTWACTNNLANILNCLLPQIAHLDFITQGETNYLLITAEIGFPEVVSILLKNANVKAKLLTLTPEAFFNFIKKVSNQEVIKILLSAYPINNIPLSTCINLTSTNLQKELQAFLADPLAYLRLQIIAHPDKKVILHLLQTENEVRMERLTQKSAAFLQGTSTFNLSLLTLKDLQEVKNILYQCAEPLIERSFTQTSSSDPMPSSFPAVAACAQSLETFSATFMDLLDCEDLLSFTLSYLESRYQNSTYSRSISLFTLDKIEKIIDKATAFIQNSPPLKSALPGDFFALQAAATIAHSFSSFSSHRHQQLTQTLKTYLTQEGQDFLRQKYGLADALTLLYLNSQTIEEIEDIDLWLSFLCEDFMIQLNKLSLRSGLDVLLTQQQESVVSDQEFAFFILPRLQETSHCVLKTLSPPYAEPPEAIALSDTYYQAEMMPKPILPAASISFSTDKFNPFHIDGSQPAILSDRLLKKKKRISV